MALTPLRSEMRQYHRKGRSGCITCKARHVKCDETKPTCLNCERVGRECEGYESQPAAPRTRQPTPFRGFRNVAFPHQALTVDRGSPREKRAMEFFTSVTISELRRYLITSFWPNHLLSEIESFDPLWQSCVAVAAIHEAMFYEEGSSTERQSDFDSALSFAQSEYGQALHLLRSEIAHRTVARHLVLFTSLMFIIFESLVGNYKEMMIHLRNAVSLVCEERSEARNDGELEAGELLKCMGIMYSLQEQPKMDHLSELHMIPLPTIRNEADRNIATTHQAGSRMNDIIVRRVMPFCDMVQLGAFPDEFSMWCEQASLINELGQWKVAFEGGLQRDPKLSLILRARFEMWLICVEAYPEQRQTSFDRYLPNFERIVRCIEDLTAPDMLHIAPLARPLFSVDTGLIQVLFFVAHRCRHRTLRRRAVELLAHVPKREGVWDATATARASNALINFEERGWRFSAGYETDEVAIPEEHRLRDATFGKSQWEAGQTPSSINIAWQPQGSSTQLEFARLDISTGALIPIT